MAGAQSGVDVYLNVVAAFINLCREQQQTLNLGAKLKKCKPTDSYLKETQASMLKQTNLSQSQTRLV